jgi:hypothetical protein
MSELIGVKMSQQFRFTVEKIFPACTKAKMK